MLLLQVLRGAPAIITILLIVFSLSLHVLGDPVDQLNCRLIIDSSDGKVYFVMDSTKHRIDDDRTLEALFFSKSDAFPLSSAEVSSIPSGNGINADWRAMSEDAFYRMANQIHNCNDLKKPLNSTEDSKGLETLLLMVDNRAIDVQTTIDKASYFILNLVINFQYAKKHGYDLVVVRLNATDLIEDVESVYHQSSREIQIELNASLVASTNLQKTGIALFHPSLGQFRSSPWAKVPVMAYTLDMLRMDRVKSPEFPQYDILFYLDSDAGMNPQLQNRSVTDFFKYWENKHVLTDCKYGDGRDVIQSGDRTCGVHISNASLVFLSNANAATFPCSGVMLAKTQGDINRRLLMNWWNTNDTVDNFGNAFEQDTLLKMMKDHGEILNHLAYIHGETEFVPCDNQWVCHLSHFYAVAMENKLRDWIRKDLGISTDELFQRELQEIYDGHHLDLPSLSLTEYIDDFLPHNGTLQSKLHSNLSRDIVYNKWKNFRTQQALKDSYEVGRNKYSPQNSAVLSKISTQPSPKPSCIPSSPPSSPPFLGQVSTLHVSNSSGPSASSSPAQQSTSTNSSTLPNNDFILIYADSIYNDSIATYTENITLFGSLLNVVLVELEDLGIYDAEIWNEKYRNLYFLALLLTIYLCSLCCRLTCCNFSCCDCDCCRHKSSSNQNYRSVNTNDDDDDDGDDGLYDGNIHLQDKITLTNNLPDEEQAFGVLEMDDEN